VVTSTSMRTAGFDSADLQRLFEEQKVCTFEQLAKALGTKARTTVFRKLADLTYVTSYSHRGKYYALESFCQFDARGLCSHRDIRFSAHGTLLDTCREFVVRAPAGYSAKELDSALHVQTRQTLLRLLRRRQVERKTIGGLLIYLAPEPAERERQISARRKTAQVEIEAVPAHQVKAASILFFGTLDERQQRLFAGLEALKIGRGGDARVAALLGMDPHMVAKGRVELLREEVEVERFTSLAAET
jgi:hypothetical protein